jgi:hypothetical protein
MMTNLVKLRSLDARDVNWYGVGGTVNNLVDGSYGVTLKLQNIITQGPYKDVKAFGAVGDGITDDSAAIQAAVDSLATGAGTVFFPPGTYLIGTTITNDYSQRGFVGLPGLSATLKVGSDIPILNLNKSASDQATHGVSYLYVSDLWFEGSSRRSAGIVGLDIQKSAIQSCRFTNFEGTTDDSYYGAIYTCFRDNLDVRLCTFYKSAYGFVIPVYLQKN